MDRCETKLRLSGGHLAMTLAIEMSDQQAEAQPCSETRLSRSTARAAFNCNRLMGVSARWNRITAIRHRASCCLLAVSWFLARSRKRGASSATPSLREAFGYGEDCVYAKKRRQSGSVETYSDLLIQREGCEAEDGSISVNGEEGDGKQEGTCDQGGGGLAVEKRSTGHHGSGASCASFSDGCSLPAAGQRWNHGTLLAPLRAAADAAAASGAAA
jgi:hypothetical protein